MRSSNLRFQDSQRLACTLTCGKTTHLTREEKKGQVLGERAFSTGARGIRHPGHR